MNDTVTVIDIVAQVTDDTASGARSAEANVTKLEKSMQNLQKQILSMKGKSKLEVAATLKDMASKGIQNVAAAGKKIAGKVWTVTLKAVDLVTAPFKKVIGLVTNPIVGAAAFAGISLGVADTLNTFKDFQQGMANVQAISGATGEEFERLTATAKQLGESTMFSAAQAAEAMENLAMAGWKTDDIIAGMPGLLNLAAAGSVDLATASDVTASALAQFKLSADEANRVADVLAATATNSKTDITGLGESFKYAGSLAGAMGFSIEDVSVAIGLMGNAAIDGSSAGTALRATLARMSKQEGLTAEESNAVVDAMRKLGISLTDEQGKAKSLMTIMREMRAGYAKLTDAEKTSTLANLAGQNAMSGMLAICQAGEEDFNKLEEAINNSAGAAQRMADTKMDTLQGSLYYLQSAAEGVKIAIGEKLQPYVRGLVDWVTAHMPDIQKAVDEALTFVTGKIDDVTAAIKDMTNSPEWQNAETLWDKVKVAWDKLIAEPFTEWWNGTGKAWIADKAAAIGEGLGSALHTGIMALLGVDVGGAVTEGADIGKAFADAFVEAFKGAEVGKAIWEAIKNGGKAMTKDALTLLPGGEEASSTSGLSAAVLGYGALKAGKTGYNIYKGGKALVNGTKAVGSAIGNVTGISEGLQIAKAAQEGGAAAQSALAFAENGALGGGVKLGAKMAGGASKVGQVASKAAIPLAAVASAIEMGVDAYHGVGKAEEWTGSSSTGNKIASGVGAALGGTGSGILGDASIGKKALDIGGGALKGAGIGAAVGSIIPGVGTAIGGAVGAGVGAVGAAIGGENIAKGLSAAGTAIKGFFTETVPEKFGQFAEGAKGFFTETVPSALGKAKAAVGGFFTETVPAKFGELKDGVTSFFTEKVGGAIKTAKDKVVGFFTETIPAKFEEFKQGLTTLFTEQIPYALGYAAGKVVVFFTETLPQKFEELWTGITDFFTQTVPNAIATAGAAITNFFTVTVPEFFTNLWNGITGFFTETVPAAIATAGAALTNFFTVTVPTFLGNLWEGIVGFFTETVPQALETIGKPLVAFFTETVPEFFTGVWEGITGFFTETVPEALEAIGQALKTFFTETVPNKVKEIWDGVLNFFTQTIPNTITNITSGITDFFDGIKQKISGFFTDLGNKITGFFNSASASASAGYNAATAAHAEGGIMTRPHVGLVAEDGAEAIIPLSGKRRERGIELWEETGKMLGVRQYAEGGIPEAAPPVPVVSAGTGGAPSVTVQNLTLEINVDGGAQDPQLLVETIKENVRGMTDEIAYQLATAMQQVFANTPRAAWEV